MPELPEVETIRLQLDQKLKGLKITDIDVLKEKSFLGNPKEVLGKKIVGVKRRAKINIIELADGVYLAVHLKMTGQLIYSQDGGEIKEGKEKNHSPFKVCELPNKFTRVIISFSSGARLFFNDLRMFGWIKVLKDLQELGLEKLGPEAIDERAFSFEYFKNTLSKSKKPVKLVILDQEKLAGVGNIYASEALFRAGILPTRRASSLEEEEIKRLRNSILEVLREAIEHRGTSDSDEAYRQISGEKGNFQNYLKVYRRAGQKCPECGGTIKRIALGGRGTFYCPNCQR